MPNVFGPPCIQLAIDDNVSENAVNLCVCVCVCVRACVCVFTAAAMESELRGDGSVGDSFPYGNLGLCDLM